VVPPVDSILSHGASSLDFSLLSLGKHKEFAARLKKSLEMLKCVLYLAAWQLFKVR
jgi:hypothetical protein